MFFVKKNYDYIFIRKFVILFLIFTLVFGAWSESMSQELRRQARIMAERYGVDANIFEKMIEAESNFNPNARNKKSGALGLGQITKSTGIQPGYGVKPIEDRLDPIENLRFSAQYYKAMLDEFGSNELALAAYNAGPGRVKGAGNKVPDITETKNYVNKVMAGTNVSRETSPVPRPSNLATGTTDATGIDPTIKRSIDRMIEDMFPTASNKRVSTGSVTRARRRGQMSPLSKLGIPGLGNIAKFSAPGGVASLMNKKKTTKI